MIRSLLINSFCTTGMHLFGLDNSMSQIKKLVPLMICWGLTFRSFILGFFCSATNLWAYYGPLRRDTDFCSLWQSTKTLFLQFRTWSCLHQGHLQKGHEDEGHRYWWWEDIANDLSCSLHRRLVRGEEKRRYAAEEKFDWQKENNKETW